MWNTPKNRMGFLNDPHLAIISELEIERWRSNLKLYTITCMLRKQGFMSDECFIKEIKGFIYLFIYFNIFIQDNKFSKAVFQLGPAWLYVIYTAQIIFDRSVSVPMFKIKFLLGIFKCLPWWCILYIIR